jgi:ribonuclease D
MDVPVEWKVRKQAVDVLVEARAGGYLTKDHKSELNSVTRANPELKQALSKGMESHKKYAVDKASDAEIANLRKTFDDVKNVNLPSLDVAGLPAEHARMDSLQRVSKAVEKSSTMLRQQLRDANRERSGPVR